MTEPTKLLSAEEFALLLFTEPSLTSVAQRYTAAVTALHEAQQSDEESTRLLFQAADERDAALKRVAELELEREVSLTMAEETHEVMDAVATQRDAALVELAVLREAVKRLDRAWNHMSGADWSESTWNEAHDDLIALAAQHEAEQAHEAATKRVAELEGELSDSRFVAVKKAHERDALAAELSELRGRTIQHILDLVPHSPHCNGGRTLYLCGKCDVTERINKEFAAQPQGERGKALLAERAAMKAAIEKYGRCTTCSGTGAPRDPCGGQYCLCKPGVGGRADTCWNCKGAKLQSWALAAIDGAQP